jgi:Cu+-exporting ATPase
MNHNLTPPPPPDTTPDVCTLDLGIGGMTCASCVGRVEKVLKKLPGVTGASVNLATESARVQWAGDPTDAAPAADMLARVSRAVRDAGYEPKPPSESETEAADPTWMGVRTDFWPILLGMLLSAPLVLPMVGDLMGKHWMLPAWQQFVLATPVQFGLGRVFYKSAWHAIKGRTGNMELLVAIGTTAAWGMSTWMWLSAEPDTMVHVYFEGAAVVITLVLLGSKPPRPSVPCSGCALKWPTCSPMACAAPKRWTCRWPNSCPVTWWRCAPASASLPMARWCKARRRPTNPC